MAKGKPSTICQASSPPSKSNSKRNEQKNEQTNDTEGNRTPPATLRQACSSLGQGHLSWGRGRPIATGAEHSRCYRAHQHDNEIVRWRLPCGPSLSTP